MNNQKVLIVDDNISLQEDFRKILMRAPSPARKNLKRAERALFEEEAPDAGEIPSFELDFASQGEEALSKVVSCQQRNTPYALVFMDIRMPPGWDGITTAAKIWEKAPSTEIVLCTAYSDSSLEEVMDKLGKPERLLFLKKPFDSVEVQQLAIALTKKWNLEQMNRKYTQDLEQLVEERTKERDLERAKCINGAKLMALGEMAGGIAHEINNPLTIIHANAVYLNDLMNGDFDRDIGLKRVQKIVKTADRIAKIIKGLRVFNRNGDSDPFEPVSISQIIDDTLGICREKFKIHEVAVSVTHPSPLPMIECREVQIVQVLLNLLNNAYDAIEALPEKWIKIEVKEAPETLEISVTDSGKGIPKEVAVKIGKPFFTTKKVGKGTGLGLSISQEILKSHQGKLWVDEECEHTRFVMSLPRQHGKSL